MPDGPEPRWLCVGTEHGHLTLPQQHTRRLRGWRARHGQGGHQRSLCIGPGAQAGADAIAVFHQCAHAEVDVPAGRAAPAHHTHLGQHFIGLPLPRATGDGAGEQARPQLSVTGGRQGHLGNPMVQQGRKGLARAVDGPVELRGQVVQPTLLHPQLNVGIQLVVLAETFDAGRAQLGSPQAKGADTKAHMGLDAAHRAVHRLHEAAHVVAPPIVAA